MLLIVVMALAILKMEKIAITVLQTADALETLLTVAAMENALNALTRGTARMDIPAQLSPA